MNQFDRLFLRRDSRSMNFYDVNTTFSLVFPNNDIIISRSFAYFAPKHRHECWICPCPFYNCSVQMWLYSTKRKWSFMSTSAQPVFWIYFIRNYAFEWNTLWIWHFTTIVKSFSRENFLSANDVLSIVSSSTSFCCCSMTCSGSLCFPCAWTIQYGETRNNTMQHRYGNGQKIWKQWNCNCSIFTVIKCAINKLGVHLCEWWMANGIFPFA